MRIRGQRGRCTKPRCHSSTNTQGKTYQHIFFIFCPASFVLQDFVPFRTLVMMLTCTCKWAFFSCLAKSRLVPESCSFKIQHVRRWKNKKRLTILNPAYGPDEERHTDVGYLDHGMNAELKLRVDSEVLCMRMCMCMTLNLPIYIP